MLLFECITKRKEKALLRIANSLFTKKVKYIKLQPKKEDWWHCYFILNLEYKNKLDVNMKVKRKTIDNVKTKYYLP